MTMKLIWRGLIVCLLLTLAWPAGLVSAHAALVSSSPAHGAALSQAPTQIDLTFSEAIDPAFSTVRLVDATGKTVVPGPGESIPGNPAGMRLSLPHLPDGVYTALWKNRSSVDGHVSEGVVSFSVGAQAPLASTLPPVGADYPAFVLPPLLDTLMRWLAYLGLAGLLGALLFGLLIWRHGEVTFDASQHTRMHGWLGQQILFSGCLLGLGSLGLLLAGAVQVSSSAIFPALLRLSTGLTGLLAGAHLLLAILAVIFARRLSVPGPGIAWPWIAATGLCLAGALTFSLQSHAAASGLPLAIFADWLHLVGISAWIGGLLPLALWLRAGHHLERLVPRFSRMALASVDVVAASGLYGLWLHSSSIGALTGTTYGRDLLVKSGLFLILVIIGTVNYLVLTPRLGQAGSRATAWLSRNIRFELAIGLAILLAAGLLAGSATGNEALLAQQRLGFVQSDEVNGVRMTLLVNPPRAGSAEYGVDLVDPRRTASLDSVLLRLTYEDNYVGSSQITLQPQPIPPDGIADPVFGTTGVRRFTARGAYMTIAGLWQATVIVRQPGVDDVYSMFFIDIARTITK